ncbi:MAG: hydantoinase B/oxoprolinase family protein, partial [Planctomycetes bacterium]|nr:hydantoinase B/oxoprolinase family protein [Planctomycetota bacterium]
AFNAKDGLLSGPAGGVIGAAHIGRTLGLDRLIAFDMGGTSTDVARVADGLEYAFEHEIGGVVVLAPALDIRTVAAGGGSICSYELGRLCVGPASAGADPGPACYGQGGPMTLTDANLLLGRVDERSFGIPIDAEAARGRLVELRETIRAQTGESIEPEDLLEGLISIADERMAVAIRAVTARRGHDPGDHALVAFGGAGGQHACGVARRLGIGTVVVPARAGVLSAVGLATARHERFAQRQVLRPLAEVGASLHAIANELADEATGRVRSMLGGDDIEVRVTRRIVSMCVAGQSATIECDWTNGEEIELLAARFARRYAALFGYEPDGSRVEVVSIRVIASAEPGHVPEAAEPDSAQRSAEPVRFTEARFEGALMRAGVYERGSLAEGHVIPAPALVVDESSTTVIPPGWEACVGRGRAVVIRRVARRHGRGARGRPEAIEQEIFTSRLEGLAHEMGESLVRTAVSTNVKDRLDFSCAILDAGGELVANAPHVPVHLGSLGECVRRVVQRLRIGPGDVVVTNHPAFGGSHLPDVTVISGVFDDEETLLAYVANRAHHAEIGGRTPGSMPALSGTLGDEGVVIEPQFLVENGTPRWEALRALLAGGPWPSRAVDENLADLRAQLAANVRGVDQLRAMARDYPGGEVARRMEAIKATAERLLVERLMPLGESEFTACESMDDGSRIQVSIRTKGGRAVIDFAGSSDVHPGNLNATPAIVRSAVLYVLRLLVDEPIPLNEGLMRAIDLRIPFGMLNPSFDAEPARCPAVAGGNVETSQRIVDAMIRALNLAAGSQGTMNNVTIGGPTWGFYETICGGAGATPNAPGAHAVHTHMTNTRITDPEMLERRYPVRLESCSIRTGSGGRGTNRGGDGVVRRMRFTAAAE